MAYIISTSGAGWQPIATNSTVKNHPLGTIVRGYDPTYGEGEFIYLTGVASTVVGSVVTWESATHVTTLAAVGANLPRPVGFAMSACVASEYGWYQVSGQAVAKKAVATSLAAAAAVGVKTTGLIASTGSGKEVQGALVVTVASAKSDVSTVLLHIERPHIQGRVT